MAAVPVADAEVEARRLRAVISGEVPSALRPPPGCSFHTRCPRAMAVCKTDQPPLCELGPGRAVAVICTASNNPRQSISGQSIKVALTLLDILKETMGTYLNSESRT